MKKLLLLAGLFFCLAAAAQTDSVDIKLKRMKELQRQGLEDSAEYNKLKEDLLGADPKARKQKDKRFYIGIQGGFGLATIFNNSSSAIKFGLVPSWAGGIGMGYTFRRFGGIMLQGNYIRRGYFIRNPNSTTVPNQVVSRFREDVVQIPVIYRSRSRGKVSFVADGGFSYVYAFRTITDYALGSEKYASQITRTQFSKRHDGEFLLGFGIMGRTRAVDMGFTVRNNFSLTTRYYSMQVRMEINFPFAIEVKEKRK